MDRFDLGTHRRSISTVSTEAQRLFDLGLNWCYGFNHAEAINCFNRALQKDPECAILHWGIAYAAGPFYNLTWQEHGPAELTAALAMCYEHIRQARSLATRAGHVENRLIHALSRRFPKQTPVTHQEFAQWDEDYAAEMRTVYRSFPNDPDVAALLVEALIMRTVRQLWDLRTGKPTPKSHVLEALTICERAIERADEAGEAQHPAILHMHIHILEMSAMPERGYRSANMLLGLCPDLGHLNHMPAHIYVLCGDYAESKAASIKAVGANDFYLEYAEEFTYYLLGCCHDLHLLMYTCMFLGKFESALWAANKLRTLAWRGIASARDRPKLLHTAEGYWAMRLHVLVRFGRWQDIINEPAIEDLELFMVTTAMQHYAKGVAHAVLGNFDDAEHERACLKRQIALIPPERRFLSNAARDSLEVGVALLDGELAYHQGRHDEAYRHLRLAVKLDDSLSYTEPWAWMHPPRHALAALLLDQGYVDAAEQVYRDDLGLTTSVQRCAQHPNNVWALHGLVECLDLRGDRAELHIVQSQLSKALTYVDLPIRSSCWCRVVRGF
jgi:tetratricopeptide (TPR) repeat protein